VVLVRMQPPPGAAANVPLQLAVTYTDRSNQTSVTRRTVGIPPALLGGEEGQAEGFYQSSGVRKAVLLARYTDLMKGW
jgi:hypothetical protein